MSRFNADNPYNDLPLLPPLVELETKAVLKRAIAANTALAVPENFNFEIGVRRGHVAIIQVKNR